MSRSGRRSGAPGRSLIERLVAHENGLIPAPMLPHDKREFPAHWTHTGRRVVSLYIIDVRIPPSYQTDTEIFPEPLTWWSGSIILFTTSERWRNFA